MRVITVQNALITGLSATVLYLSGGGSVEANEYIVRDKGGAIRARLWASDTEARLVFYGDGGRELVGIGVEGEERGYAVYDAEGKKVVWLGVDAAGDGALVLTRPNGAGSIRAGTFEGNVAGLRLLDGEGRTRGEFSIQDSGAAVMSLCNTDGQPQLNLTASLEGEASIQLNNEDGEKARVAIVHRDDGPSGLQLMDDDGAIRAFLGTGADGQVGVSFYDDSGAVRCALLANDSGAGLVIMDQAGAVVFKAP